jgi:hypothetical protein
MTPDPGAFQRKHQGFSRASGLLPVEGMTDAIAVALIYVAYFVLKRGLRPAPR